MKFIFPKNYDIKPKIFNFFDVQTLIHVITFNIIIFWIFNLFIENIFLIIQFNIILTMPIILLAINGVNGENLYYFLSYIVKYIFRKKVHLYYNG